MNLLIGVTGSVATIKLPLLIEKFLENEPNLKIRIVTTNAAKHFIKDYLQILNEELILKIKKKDGKEFLLKVYDDELEWKSWSKIGDPIQHIELRRWADIFLIAPLDANTLAKAANGLSDNLLTSILRAWDIKDFKKKIIIAPAMNTLMFNNPFTNLHIKTLIQLFDIIVIPTVSKLLACGDLGDGAMASVDTIVKTTLSFKYD